MTAGVVGCDPALSLWPQLDPRLPSVSHLGPPVPPGRSSTGQDGGGGGGGAGLVLSRPSAPHPGAQCTLWVLLETLLGNGCADALRPLPSPAPCQREAPPPQPELLLGEDCGGGAGAGWKQACLSLPWSQPKAPSSGSGGRRHTSLGACEHKGPGLRLGPVGGCVPGVWVGGRLRQLLPCPPQGKVL